MRCQQSGQVLAFFALALPVVLLPVAAYAVDSTIVAAREAGLQAATAQAAETAAQQLNIGALRSGGPLMLDAAAVWLVADQTLVDEEAGASVDSYTVTGAEVKFDVPNHHKVKIVGCESRCCATSTATCRLYKPS